MVPTKIPLLPDFDDSIFTPEIIVEHAERLAAVEQIHPKDIFKTLLSHLDEINFIDRAEVEDGKITNAHYRIITIREILSAAKLNQWDLCRNQAFVYAFNGCYWSLLESDNLRAFLGQAAKKMGVPWVKAEDYVFTKQLLEQFLDSAHFPKPDKTDGVLIPLLNGTFEVSSGKRILRGFDKRDFLTYQLPFNYDPTATAPIFENYLNEALPDEDSQKVLAEYLGYLFTKGLKLEKALILYGPGANGKSVMFEVISRLLGESNVCNYSLSSLTDGNGYYRAMLANKLVNYASEINGNLEASLFKQLVSGEPVEARLPYGIPMTISDYAKLIFNTNILPHDVEHTHAYFRRFTILDFNVTIKAEKQDVELAKKIIHSELPGVFNWVLSGLDRILENKKFTHCDAVNNRLELFRKESDTVALFLEDAGYVKGIDPTPLKQLYPMYRTYCMEGGYRPVALRKVSERLRNLGFETEKVSLGIVVFTSRA